MKPFIKPRQDSEKPRVPTPTAAPVTEATPRISPSELTIFGVASALIDPAERAAAWNALWRYQSMGVRLGTDDQKVEAILRGFLGSRR